MRVYLQPPQPSEPAMFLLGRRSDGLFQLDIAVRDDDDHGVGYKRYDFALTVADLLELKRAITLLIG